MRKIWVATFVALISVMFMVGMSQAALLTLESNHAITAVLTLTGGGEIAPSSYVMRSGVNGAADYTPSESGTNNSAIISTPVPPTTTAAATLGGTHTWLTTTDATTTHATATTFTMAQQFVGSAPNPSTPGGNDGALSQAGNLIYPSATYVSNYFKLTYTGLAAGSYTAGVTDLYTFLYSLQQAAGSTNLYHTTDGYMFLNMRATSSSGSGGLVYAKIVEDGRGASYPLADFDLQNANSGGDTANLSFALANVTDNSTVTIEGWLSDYQDGSSYNVIVPTPSTMLLLGSGLMGLGLLRRKWSLRK
jgi:hypothetical protein